MADFFSRIDPTLSKSVLRYIRQFTRKNGVPPTVAEIMTETGIPEREQAQAILKGLEISGWIRWRPGANREIVLSAWARSASPWVSLRSRPEPPDAIPWPRSHKVRPTIPEAPDAFRSVLPRLAPAYAIPLMGTIAGGKGVLLFDADTQPESDQYSLPGSMLPAHIDPKSVFALLVEGDSMRDDGIADGDVVFVTRTDIWESQDIMAVFIKEEKAATLKRLIRTERGLIELRPANPAFPSRIVSPDEIQVQGRVIAVIKKM